jgi:hypothetical protein
MKNALLLASAVVALVAAPVRAADYPAVAVPPLDLALMKDTVKTLSSDAFEGRGPASSVEPCRRCRPCR